MKFSCLKTDFNELLTRVAPAAVKKNTGHTWTDYVQLEAKNDPPRIIANTSDTSIYITSSSTAQIEQEGTISVPFKMLQPWCQRALGDRLRFSLREKIVQEPTEDDEDPISITLQQLICQSGTNRTTLILPPQDAFPNLPQIQTASWQKFNSEHLQDAIKNLSALKGELHNNSLAEERKGFRLTLEDSPNPTDLAEFTLEIAASYNCGQFQSSKFTLEKDHLSMTLPVALADVLKRSVAKEMTLSVTEGGKVIRIDDGITAILSGVQSGNWPRQQIDKMMNLGEYPIHITVSKVALVNSLQDALMFGDSHGIKITFRMNKGILKMSSEASNKGAHETELSIDGYDEEDELLFCANGLLLNNLLASLNKSPIIHMYIHNNTTPIAVSGGDGCQVTQALTLMKAN